MCRIRAGRPILVLIGVSFLAAAPNRAVGQNGPLPVYLRDRGPGIATSMWATFVVPKQFVAYPFFAYSTDHNREYQPAELGFGTEKDFIGRFRMTECQIFAAYGVSDRLAVEVEAAYLSARLDKDANDHTEVPARNEASGFGDMEGQLRYRILHEAERRPEIFGYMEITAPSNRNSGLIGDERWDVRPGVGVIRGFGWGTMMTRVTVEYNHPEKHFDLGEFAVAFLKKLNPSVRLNLGLEGGEGGAPDEWELISGLQWWTGSGLVLRFDNSLGISPKATDWAPQFGVMFRMPS